MCLQTVLLYSRRCKSRARAKQYAPFSSSRCERSRWFLECRVPGEDFSIDKSSSVEVVVLIVMVFTFAYETLLVEFLPVCG